MLGTFKFKRRSALASVLAFTAISTALPARAAGTWTPAPASQANNGPAFGLWLLTDGTVLSHGNALNHWVILTPDKTGSYANGTWKSVASSAFARGGAQEHVLKDGRFFEAGGEYLYVWPAHDGVAACSSSCNNPPSGSPLYKNVEIYDPVADTWTVKSDGLYDIGDTGSATLGDGRILDSTRTGNAIQIYDPSSDTWTAGAPATNPNGDENSWASLQNGGVLAVAPKSTSIYDPASNSWVPTGPLPSGFAVTLTAASKYPGTYDFGDAAGISLMFDGRVLTYGLGTTAIYTPGATASSPGTWALGPNMPYKTGPNDGTPGNDAEDGYSVTEPNGKVMIATYPFGGSPDILQEYDPATNKMAEITPPPDTANPYPVSYLDLPNGQVLVTCGALDWLYTPDSAPDDAWRPTVTSVVFNSGNTYTLTGTQISGLINGADEGDDMTMAENYPIVFLKDDSGNVYFCKSFNFSSMMPSRGNAPETCQFTTPPGLPQGTYDLYVSAVGVQSKTPLSFMVGVGGMSDGGIAADEDASVAPDDAAGADSSSSGSASSGGGGGNEDAGPAEGGPSSSGGPGSGVAGADGGGEDGPSRAAGCACRTARSGGMEDGLPVRLGAFAAIAAFRRRRRPRPGGLS